MRWTKTTAQRFWSKVDKSPHPRGCWVWIGCTSKKTSGYGRFRGSDGRSHVSSRWIYQKKVNAIPPGYYVLHDCDNSLCVNPKHLYLGTQYRNMKDMRSRGRERKAHGEGSGMSKLTEAEIIEIRMRASRGEKKYLIAKDYGVTGSLVSCITLGKIWRHLPMIASNPKRSAA